MKYPIRRDSLRAAVHPGRIWSRIILAGILISLLSLGSLTILPAAFPSLGANAADLLRVIFGVQPVARLESLSFELHDALNRTLYRGDKPQISWDNSTLPGAFAPSQSRELASVRAPGQPPLPGKDVVGTQPQIGWQAYGPDVNGAPVMAQAMVMLDPQRSYTGVALVRMDLSKLQLHIMPGTIEPGHPAQIAQAVPDLGMIPPDDQKALLAAFNGGFKGIHGHYGMMANGVTLLPPIPGIATVAIYRDGHVQIGAWGKEVVPSADMTAFRQNCPPLIEAGQINPDLSLDNRKAWGYTGNTDITWRTGIGITQDGRYLIYAVGNGTSAETLAEALLKAGAYNAMQLDINQFYAHFYTYQPVGDSAASQGFQMTGQRLLDEMINNPHLYLTPNIRDFFYLTAR
jgi:hypothetical protein